MPLYKKDTLSFTEFNAHTQSYLFLTEDIDNYFAPFDNLTGITVQAPDVNQTDPVTIAKAVFRRGQIFTQNKVVRGGVVTGYTFPLLFPQGSWQSSVLSRRAANFSLCENNYYLVLLCPERACDQHFIEFRESILSPFQFSTDLVTVQDSPVPIEGTSSLYTPDIWMYWYLTAEETIDEATAFYAAAYANQACSNCADPNLIGVYGGGVGPATTVLSRTTNGFMSGTAIVPTLSHPIITSLYASGDTIVGTYADTADPATATDGGIFISNNNGTTYVDVPLTEGMFDVTFGGGWYVAVGADGTVVRSLDGVNWTALTALSATNDYHRLSYDKFNKAFWIVGANGANSVVVRLIDDAQTDMTATVAFGAAILTAVKVLDDLDDGTHIFIGTSTGVARESVDGGTTWQAVATGTTSAINAVLGNSTRTLIGAGTQVLERSPLTEREFRPVALDTAAFTGDITNGAQGEPDGGLFPGMNHFVFVTDDGEVVRVTPCDPFV